MCHAVKRGGGGYLRELEVDTGHLLDRHLIVLETNGLEPVAQRSHQQLLIEAV